MGFHCHLVKDGIKPRFHLRFTEILCRHMVWNLCQEFFTVTDYFGITNEVQLCCYYSAIVNLEIPPQSRSLQLLVTVQPTTFRVPRKLKQGLHMRLQHVRMSALQPRTAMSSASHTTWTWDARLSTAQWNVRTPKSPMLSLNWRIYCWKM